MKIFKSVSFTNFKNAILGVLKRTPLSLFLALLVFAINIFLIINDDLSQNLTNILYKTMFTLSLSFFFSIAIYFLGESKNIANSKKWIYQISTFVFGSLFYYFFEENVFSNFETDVVVYIGLTIIGVVSFLFVSPFYDELKTYRLNQDEFYVSSYSLLIRVIMAKIVGLVSMLLGFAALTAVFTLFDIDYSHRNNWYSYWASFSIIIFAPIYFLANLPEYKKENLDDLSPIQSNKFYAFLINYVSLPAIFVYFLILYSYTIKVLINFSEWPHGEVAWLVIIFSFFGYVVYFASFAFVGIFKPAKLLRKFLPIAVLFQTFMLFYAIGLRIRQYDITINRYLVLTFGFWLLGLSLYYIFSKRKDIAMPFYSLLIIVIFISIGPWSVYSIPKWRQLNNLEGNLIQAGILQEDGVIKYLENYQDIDSKLSGEIYGGISYLANYHGYKSLNRYFEKEIDWIIKEDKKDFEERKKRDLERAENASKKNEENFERIKKREYLGPRNWVIASKVSEKIKVRRYFKNNQKNEIPKTFNFRNNESVLESSIDVRGFDFFAQVSSENIRSEELLGKFESSISKEKILEVYRAYIDVKNEKLELYLGDNLVETFQLKDSVIDPLLLKKEKSLDLHNGEIVLSGDDMTFSLNGLNYNLKLVMRNIHISNPDWKKEGGEDDDLKYFMDNGYVLIKKK